MDRQPQRRLAPHRIGVRRAHLEHVVAGIEIRQRDAALRAEIDPVVGQAGHAIREPVVLRRAEIQHAEIERHDAAAIVESDAVAQPERRRACGSHTEHVDVRQRDARRLAVLGQCRRIEDVEAAGSAERDAPVAQPKVSAERKLLALQAVLAMVSLDGARRGVEPHEPGIAAQPESAARVGNDAVERVARQAVGAR